jgi:hypothetical protein
MPERESHSAESLEALKSAEHLRGAERPEADGHAEKAERPEDQIESARRAVEQAPQPQPKGEHESRAVHHATKLDKESAYWDTLRSVQRHLKPASRQFSKVIHTPVVERTSEIVGATVARPSVTLGATTTALFVGAFLYISARAYGFTLSGSEILLSLIVGGVLGLVVEFVGKVFRRSV